ncbi:MAG: WD40 repeat domain-containing protein [Bernardetiaceae bacterium]|nr:WD40 repeat domain-containing protein [Bernardetiaceae bacterium]
MEFVMQNNDTKGMIWLFVEASTRKDRRRTDVEKEALRRQFEALPPDLHKEDWLISLSASDFIDFWEANKSRIALLHVSGYMRDWEKISEKLPDDYINQMPALELLFLSGSAEQHTAKKLAERHNIPVLHTSAALEDEANARFIGRFYQVLLTEKSLQEAYKEALSQVQDLKLTAESKKKHLLHTPEVQDIMDALPSQLYAQQEQKNAPFLLPLWSNGTNTDSIAMDSEQVPPLKAAIYEHLPETHIMGARHLSEVEAAFFVGREDLLLRLWRGCTQAHAPAVQLLAGGTAVGKTSFIEAALVPRLRSVGEVRILRSLLAQSPLELLQTVLEKEQQSWYQAWHALEQRYQKPLFICIDQCETFFKNAQHAVAWQSFADALNEIFTFEQEQPIKGRILLSVRNTDSHPLVQSLAEQGVLFEKHDIYAISEEEIAAYLQNLSNHLVLDEKYNLDIPEELIQTMAKSLSREIIAEERGFALQFAMAYMQQLAENPKQLNPNDFREAQQKGLQLEDFMRHCFRYLKENEPKHYESGLFLDILYFHIYPEDTEGFLRLRQRSELLERYEETYSKSIEAHLDLLCRLGLLVRTGKAATALAHARFAPIIQKAFYQSVFPIQRVLHNLQNQMRIQAQNPEHLLSLADWERIDKYKKILPQLPKETKNWIDKSKPVEKIDKKIKSKKKIQHYFRIRNARFVLLLLAAISIVFLVWIWQQKNEAEDLLVSKAFLKISNQALQNKHQAVAAEADSLFAAYPQHEMLIPTKWILQRPPTHLYQKLKAHDAPVRYAEFAPNGKKIITRGDKPFAALFDSLGNLQKTLRLHEENLITAIFSKDSEQILTASGDGMLALWDSKGNLTKQVKERFRLRYATLEGQRLLCVSDSGKIRLRTKNGDFVKDLEKIHSGKIPPQYAPNGSKILTTNQNFAHVFDSEGNLLLHLKHNENIEAAVFAPNGQYILTFGEESQAQLWNLKGERIATLGRNTTYYAAFAPDGEHVICLSTDNKTRIFDKQGELLHVHQHAQRPQQAVWRPDSRAYLLFFEKWDAPAELRQRNGDIITAFEDHNNRITYAAFYGSDRLLIASKDWTARLYALGGLRQKLVNLPSLPKDWVHHKTKGIWLTQGKEVLFFNAENSNELFRFKHAETVQTIAISPDGNYIFTAATDNSIRVWTAEGNLLTDFRGHKVANRSLAILPDGDRFLSLDVENNLMLNDLKGGMIMHIKPQKMAYHIGFTADKVKIFCTESDSVLRIYDMEGRLLSESAPHGGRIADVHFRRDMSQYITACDDGKIRFFSLEGKLLKTLDAHRDKIQKLIFKKDEQQFVSLSHDHSLKLWTFDGDLLAVLSEHRGRVNDAAFSPEQTHIISVGEDARIILWNAKGEYISEIKDEMPLLSIGFFDTYFYTINRAADLGVWKWKD